MPRRRFLLAPMLALAAPALAQNLPPQNALPLSQVIASVEKAQPVRAFTEIEWDDDGYWDIEFINQSDRRASVRIDPVTGEPWSRRR